jgi:hypothetical protein
MNFVVVIPEHVDLMSSGDGRLTETCEGNKYLQIESHWAVLIYNLDSSCLKYTEGTERDPVDQMPPLHI